jgi:hypothetical protein
LGINPNNTSLAVRNLNVFKTAPGEDLFVPNFRPPYSQQASIGVQRQVTSDITVSADFVYRHFLNERIRNTDLNHFYAAQGPVIPACASAAEALNPAADCSTGVLQFDVSGGRSTYKGLLLRIDKRLSRNFMFVTSYAYQDINGYNGLHLDSNWNASNGPTMGRQELTFSGVWNLPLGFEVSTITTFGSRGPFEPVLSGLDLYGDGSGNSNTVGSVPLPGAGYNRFGVTLNESDLARYVNQFNQQYAGKTTPTGQAIPTITLPAHYSFGRNSTSEDFRATKTFRLRERVKLNIFGEVFNAFNYANLGGYGDNLLDPGFGQATSRAGQVFGSGGPRAFQVGGRVSF